MLRVGQDYINCFVSITHFDFFSLFFDMKRTREEDIISKEEIDVDCLNEDIMGVILTCLPYQGMDLFWALLKWREVSIRMEAMVYRVLFEKKHLSVLFPHESAPKITGDVKPVLQSVLTTIAHVSDDFIRRYNMSTFHFALTSLSGANVYSFWRTVDYPWLRLTLYDDVKLKETMVPNGSSYWNTRDELRKAFLKNDCTIIHYRFGRFLAETIRVFGRTDTTMWYFEEHPKMGFQWKWCPLVDHITYQLNFNNWATKDFQDKMRKSVKRKNCKFYF